MSHARVAFSISACRQRDLGRMSIDRCGDAGANVRQVVGTRRVCPPLTDCHLGSAGGVCNQHVAWGVLQDVAGDGPEDS